MGVDTYHHQAIPAATGAPLLFLFHGTGGDEMQLLPIAHSVLPDAGVVAPRGDVEEHGANRFFRRHDEGIYDMEDLARATDKMSDFVRAHIAEQRPEKVVGLGYSNGANILASVVFADPTLFETVVLMHPLIPFKPQIGGTEFRTRVLVTAGREDPICPPSTTQRLMSYLKGAGARAELLWHHGGHELRPEEVNAAARFLAE
ncbi:alpha/beta hydrolase [Chelativorans sp. YIM 93263]|uniref:alpha/beta hydrolase n=1 Tax=Chelativorans sp. YIM 93263 TaxID=2906648 RepID=UPI002378D74B|nr:alpha/beta hydrolase [Chelativorans sp. YIM 93263]